MKKNDGIVKKTQDVVDDVVAPKAKEGINNAGQLLSKGVEAVGGFLKEAGKKTEEFGKNRAKGDLVGDAGKAAEKVGEKAKEVKANAEDAFQKVSEKIIETKNDAFDRFNKQADKTKDKADKTVAQVQDKAQDVKEDLTGFAKTSSRKAEGIVADQTSALRKGKPKHKVLKGAAGVAVAAAAAAGAYTYYKAKKDQDEKIKADFSERMKRWNDLSGEDLDNARQEAKEKMPVRPGRTYRYGKNALLGEDIVVSIVPAGEEIHAFNPENIGQPVNPMEEIRNRAQILADQAGSKAKTVAANVAEKAKEVGAKAKDVASDLGAKAKESTGDLGSKARNVADDLGHKAKEVGAKAKDVAGDLGEKARHGVEEVKEKVGDKVEESKLTNQKPPAELTDDSFTYKPEIDPDQSGYEAEGPTVKVDDESLLDEDLKAEVETMEEGDEVIMEAEVIEDDFESNPMESNGDRTEDRIVENQGGDDPATAESQIGHDGEGVSWVEDSVNQVQAGQKEDIQWEEDESVLMQKTEGLRKKTSEGMHILREKFEEAKAFIQERMERKEAPQADEEELTAKEYQVTIHNRGNKDYFFSPALLQRYNSAKRLASPVPTHEEGTTLEQRIIKPGETYTGTLVLNQADQDDAIIMFEDMLMKNSVAVLMTEDLDDEFLVDESTDMNDDLLFEDFNDDPSEYEFVEEEPTVIEEDLIEDPQEAPEVESPLLDVDSPEQNP